jgi:hypothetical protein
MKPQFGDVFADTAFWISLVIKQDNFHERSLEWSLRVNGRIVTTAAVLLETANAFAKPAWRAAGIALIDHIRQRSDVEVVALSSDLWERGWGLFRERPDKGRSLTDCISFLVMRDAALVDALTSDEHFLQAGFRALLREAP